MNQHVRNIWPALIAALTLSIFSVAAIAHEYDKGDLRVDHPWARPTFSSKVPGAVFFEIVNKGGAADRLLSVRTDFAEKVEIHVTEKNAEGVASMRMLKDGLAVPAHETVSLETGSYHVMLFGLAEKLETGQSFPVVLTFEKAGDVEIVVKVEDRAPKKTGHNH